MVHALIVDDEPECCEELITLLREHCPDIHVLLCCHSATEALKAISQLQPSLVFLDICMPGINGFELLDRLPAINFHLIFITGYEAYATEAFRYNAIDYLLKPVVIEELKIAVQKVRMHHDAFIYEQIETLLQRVNHLYNHNHIALPTLEGLIMVNIDNIISCSSDSNYTKLHLKNHQKIVVSKTLKDIEELLHDYSFFRVHHSHLVNINEIEKYIKGDGGYLVMSNGMTIDVSRNKRDLLLKKLTQINN